MGGEEVSGIGLRRWHGPLCPPILLRAALGATLHTMVVGEPPFMAANEFLLVEKLKHQEFRLRDAVVGDPHLRNLINRCLVKVRGGRMMRGRRGCDL